MEKRYAYVILDTEVNAQGEYRACVAVEGEKGYNRTDWFWGKDRKIAQQCADDRNEAVGISKQDAIKIVLGTMRK